MLSMGRACIVGYWRNPTWIPQVSPTGWVWGRHWEGKRREKGNFRNSCKKFKRVNMTVEPQEITETVQKFSVLCDVYQWMRGSVCV